MNDQTTPAGQAGRLFPDVLLTDERAEEISLRAGQVFQPATPISRRELFTGRMDQVRRVVDTIGNAGQHVVIHGERGVGKTSLANMIAPLLPAVGRDDLLVTKVNSHAKDTFGSLWCKAFEEISVTQAVQPFGFARSEGKQTIDARQLTGIGQDAAPDDIRRVLATLPNAVFIFDEFDRLQRVEARVFTDLIKMMSDYALTATLVLVGVGETVQNLVVDHGSIGRSLVQVLMPRMSRDEMEAILNNGATQLGIQFSAECRRQIVDVSQGFPHYAHLLGLASVRSACARKSPIVESADFRNSAREAVDNANESLTSAYIAAIQSAHGDAIHSDVLLACAVAQKDERGSFQAAAVCKPLAALRGKPMLIATFSRHLADFCTKKRATVLQVSGQARRRRFRFRDPMMPTYVVLRGLASGKPTNA